MENGLIDMSRTVAEEKDEDSHNGMDGEQPGKYHVKTQAIEDACSCKDLETLSALATTDLGLLEDSLRQQAWPLLLGIDPVEPMRNADWRTLPPHQDESQVGLDVERAFVYYPNGLSTTRLEERKKELSVTIIEVLRRHPFLCYFQGFHDICQVVLLVLGHECAVAALERISLLRIRDYMLPSLAPAIVHLKLLPSILDAEDAKLSQHLSQTEPFFALASTLTLYAHDIQEYGQIARLFDVLLAQDTIFPIYMFAQIVLDRKAELLDIPSDEPEMLHSILCKLPKPLDLEGIIARSLRLMKTRSPESIKFWKRISTSSALKTGRSPVKVARQDLDLGHRMFKTQAAEFRRAEIRQAIFRSIWNRRGPAGAAGIAIAAGLLAWWIGGRPNPAPASYLFAPILSIFKSLRTGLTGIR